MTWLNRTFYVFLWLYARTRSQTCKVLDVELPQALEQHQAIYWTQNNSIYIFGGKTGAFGTQMSTKIFKWDLREINGSFIEIGTTPTDSFSSPTNNAVLLNDTVYFVGLDDGNSYTDGNMYRYHLPSAQWLNTEAFNKPLHPRISGCLSTNGSHLFLVDGITNKSTASSYLQIYNVDTDRWSADSTPVNTTEWFEQYCFIVNNVLFVFGGMFIQPNGKSGEGRTTYKYEIQKQEWKKIGGHQPWGGHAVYYKPYIYFVEYNGFRAFDVENEKLVPNITEITPKITYWSASAVVNGDLFIFGGKAMNTIPQTLIQQCDLYEQPSNAPTTLPIDHISTLPNTSLSTTTTAYASTLQTAHVSSLSNTSLSATTNTTNTKIFHEGRVDSFGTTDFSTTNANETKKTDNNLTSLWIIVVSSIVVLCVVIMLMFKLKKKEYDRKEMEQSVVVMMKVDANTVVKDDVKELEVIGDKCIMNEKPKQLNFDTSGYDTKSINKENKMQEEAELKQWVLSTLGLPMFVYNAFMQNRYESLQFVKEITEIDELKNIGILNEEHQKEIIAEIEKLQIILNEITNDNIVSDGELEVIQANKVYDNEYQNEECGEVEHYYNKGEYDDEVVADEEIMEPGAQTTM